MRDSVSNGKVTRHDLKEILRVNFELYRDEPDFYDYLTTLVIYLMKYEFTEEPQPDERPIKPITSAQKQPSGPAITVNNKPAATLTTRFTPREGHCPHCNSVIDTKKTICPYCLAMIRT